MKDEDNKTEAGKEEKATCGVGAEDPSCLLENDQGIEPLRKGQGSHLKVLSREGYGAGRGHVRVGSGPRPLQTRGFMYYLYLQSLFTTPLPSPYLQWGAQRQSTWGTATSMHLAKNRTAVYLKMGRLRTTLSNVHQANAEYGDWRGMMLL